MRNLTEVKNTPKVSVIIPCYNLGQYIRNTLDSVKAQTFTDYEVIIVDDGSTDQSTKNILSEFSDKGITVLRTKNRKLPGARNFGIEHAKGEYITCLDADDMLAATYLEKTVAVLDEDKAKKIAFVTTWVKEFGMREDIWRTNNFDIVKLLANNVAHAGSLFRRKTWQEIGGYKDRMVGGYEDWELWLSMVERGYRWASIPEALFFYRIRANSMLESSKDIHIELYNRIVELHPDLFKKYAGRLAVENSAEQKQLHEVIKSKNHAIAELEQFQGEVISLREELFRLRDQLNNMRNSRVLGRIIKVRDFVGGHRNYASPRYIAHEARVAFAPLIPGPLRRFIKKYMKKILGREPKLIIQDNEKWVGGPLVSVVIPYYNRADTIDDTLDSLTNQTFQNFETIIVDDGSVELESAKKFKSFSKHSLSPKLITQKNQGVAVSRNHGIKEAAGKYIVCLDSDDAIAPTYIEKATVLLESNPSVSIATTYQRIFGVTNELFKNEAYDALKLLRGNMVVTAAEFTKAAWQNVGGYKPGIGYEDWEFWVNLSEHGYWGKLIPEPLFYYRTAMDSRFVGDKEAHWANTKSLQNLHPNYQKTVKKLLAKARRTNRVVDTDKALLNLMDKKYYKLADNNRKNILILVPWLTFGGAETLILNFCREVCRKFNLTFMTGLASENEWEYKFREVTERIYHLTNLFDNEQLYVEFISNYIVTRNIDAIHIIHTDWAFPLLTELKRRHPKLKVGVTLFNDRAAHFEKAMAVNQLIDVFTSDNNAVDRHYRKELGESADTRVIANAVNSSEIYNPLFYDRKKHRTELGLGESDLAIFFIGRLSEEKNPDVFLHVAEQLIERQGGLHFFVIGDGLMTEQIKKMITDINSDNVRYLGYKAEVARYLSAADIFVLPSSIEGFPLSILEAMAMQVAVVASDVGAVSEVIEDGKDGLVVRPGSEADIIKAIEQLANDHKLLSSIKKNGRRKVESKYSNVVLGKNYKRLYEDLSK